MNVNVNVPPAPDPTARIRRMIELARSHVEAGGFGAAGVYYRMIMKDTSPPQSGVARVAHGEACVWYAQRSLAEGKIGAAADWYQQALLADPLATDYRVDYVVKVLLPMGALKNARIEAERSTKMAPDNPRAWRTLGGIEHVMGNVAASVAAYDRQLELSPADPIARLDRATIALDTADYDTVRAMVIPVLDGKHRGDALHCLAMAAYREGRHEDAIGLYDHAIAANCYDPELALWNKSLPLHSIGRYREGWAAHEARGRQKTDPAMALMMKRFTRPMWNGEPAPARLHIHQEMGHGDIIAMARYIPLLIERGYDVRLEVMEPMIELLQRSFPQCRVLPRAVDYPGAMGIPDFDYHIPMLSLPAMFKTDIDSVPWSGPYLKPNPDLVAQYRSKLPERQRKIGLCWSSGIRTDGLWISEYGRRKSMHFDQLRRVIHWDKAFHQNNEMVRTHLGPQPTADCFVSLQVGPERKQNDGSVLDLLPEKPSWDDTAALVECLDMVITVDTSVAHLAGAMGKPVMLLMHTEGSWHWMTKRLDSPWYPSARLYRQRAIHQWGDVVEAVAAELSNIESYKAAS